MTPAPPTSPSWRPNDVTTEEWLTDKGARFTYVVLPADQIKRKESRANQARACALDPEVVERYTAGFLAGEKFPALVAYPNGRGVVIVDGNHRDEAALKARIPDRAAYVLAADTPSSLLETLLVEANTRHGLPTSTEWRQQQAVTLLALGHPVAEVARITGLPERAVTQARKAAAAADRAQRLGLRGFSDLPLTGQAVLGGLGDPVLAAAYDMATSTDWSTSSDAFRGFVVQLRKAPSEAEALQMIGATQGQREYAAQSNNGRRRSQLANPRMRVLTALGAMAAVNASELPRLFRTPAERREVADRCATAALVLMEAEAVLLGGDGDED